MGAVALVGLSIGLAMDAFAASICKGIQNRQSLSSVSWIVAVYFAGFQTLMPWLGYLLGHQVGGNLQQIDHWFTLIVLGFLGIQMIRQSFQDLEESVEREVTDPFGLRAMLPIALATSVDAFAVGVTFAFLQVQLGLALLLIGVITFGLTWIGSRLGTRLGTGRFRQWAERLGGVILLLMGVKTALEHLIDHGFLSHWFS